VGVVVPRQQAPLYRSLSLSALDATMATMGFLSRLFGGGRFRSTLEAHPALTPVVAAMKHSNVQPALQLYQASSGDAELRVRLVQATALLFGNAETRTILLDAWVKNTPDDPFAAMVRARWRIKSAPTWYPDDEESVAEAARKANQEAAEFARTEYERIAQAQPEDPVPWTLMLNLPLVFSMEDLQRLYAHVIGLCPTMFDAHLSMHHWLSAMWYGDHEQSLDLLRQVAAKAPAGTDLQLLPLYAHLSIYTYEKFFGEDKEAAQKMLTDSAVTAEVHQAMERSLESPQYQPGHYSLWARHAAAVWFNEAGDQARARTQLTAVGDAFDEDADPWNLSAGAYQQIRKQLGL
jgi:hypothetical protein